MKTILYLVLTFIQLTVFAQLDSTLYSIPKVDIPLDSSMISNDQEKIIQFGGPEASFPGGNDSLLLYVQNNFNCFPANTCINIKETIYIRFNVEKNGKLTDVEVIKGSHLNDYDCYIDFIKNMPNWIPSCYNSNCTIDTVMFPITISY